MTWRSRYLRWRLRCLACSIIGHAPEPRTVIDLRGRGPAVTYETCRRCGKLLSGRAAG